MNFNYNDVSKYGLNCMRVTGVQEHGQRMAFTIDDETADEIYNQFSGANPYEGGTVNVFADGSIILMTCYYNYSAEEWFEDEDTEFLGKGKDIITEAMNECLRNFPVANRQGLRLTSVAEVIDYLKTI